MGGVKTGFMAGAMTLAAVGIALGQEPASSDQDRARQIQARFQMLAMEGVLEKAVQLGAQRMRKEVEAAAPDASDMLLITGAARVRGFWLDGYGVFFDVDVPAMRRSLTWTLRVLEQGDRGLGPELAALRRLAASVENPAARRDLQQTIQRIEAQVGSGAAGPAPATGGVRSVSGAAGMSAREPERPAVLEDPGAVYTSEVKNALVEAMIEYSAALPLAPNEWLTVAARDQDVSRLQPGDPYDVSTILVRIKGSDLAAFRTRQITRDEALQRIEFKEY